MMDGVQIRSVGVACVVLKSINNIFHVLCLKRNFHPKDAWCYIGGKIKVGESSSEAALREIFEETAIQNVKLYSADICEQFYEIERNSIWLAPVFVGYVAADEQVTLNHEHSEYNWLTAEEAIERVSFPNNRNILKHIAAEFIKKVPSELLKINIEA